MEYDVQARPGQALVAMKPSYGDFDEVIYIPKGSKSRTPAGRMGQVISITMYPEGVNSLAFVKGVLKPMPMYVFNDYSRKMLEKFVLCRFPTHLFGLIYMVRLEHIQAIVPDEMMPSEEELGRCKYCKTEGEGNVLLGHDGFCPNCGFNKHDVHQSMAELDITEDDIDHLVRNPAEVDHFMRTGGKAVTGKVYSFAGQKNRGGNVMAELHELNRFMKERHGKK
jgi:hypothetical protein